MKRKSWKTLGSSIKQKSKLKNEPGHIVKNIKELANKQPCESLQKSDIHINRTIKESVVELKFIQLDNGQR